MPHNFMNHSNMLDYLKNKKILCTTSIAHLFYDGVTNMQYLLFALWQQQFGLSMGQVGMLKMLFTGAMSALQIPAGELGRIFGERKILIGGTLLISASLLLYTYISSMFSLIVLIIVSGISASVQHPLASSFISRNYSFEQTRPALSTYNFFGDVGKGVIPSLFSLLLIFMVWDTAIRYIALIGLLVSLTLRFQLPKDNLQSKGKFPTTPKNSSSLCSDSQLLISEDSRKKAFIALCAIGCLDNATRTGALTFFPFIMAEKGASASVTGFSLTVLFIGGAAGKLVCGVLAPDWAY